MSRVHLQRGTHAATLVIDNPHRGNALTPAMMREASDLLSQLAGELRATGGPFGGVVIRGAGDRAFCAGYDLATLEAETRTRPGLVIPELLDLVEVIQQFPVPTIAALHGHAIGGGALLASLCDLRYARGGVRFRIPTTRIGIVYPLDGLRRLAALLGLGRATEVLLLAEDVSTENGLLWGLYQEVSVSPDALSARIAEVTASLAARAPLAVSGTLAVLRSLGRGVDESQVQAWHAEWLARCVTSDDIVEGLQAARERRTPSFRGV
ncbi:MAG: enoyl-CoA hydratase/isomerase family protein [Deltaproteobacteria bacterium]|nr:enoyl-CoA hydratase/isomerase family protein [Deltaproteobacteria bacterium]